ncbi:DUF421 domain-containing protein [Cytophagaceae bacterium YF14B1]|uniref:DUF421 domain-containing protein n=1 Tax=Xanthocytophaga flava TaxID=3048013 RepID=A0AAE3QSR9_9BACT|nr:YetF domain-containing protein [Xanthocytophaga flavus]MDJ1482810.1 DUF421 domain-containing protein [Xanthocytophaga flavus]
MQNEWAEIFIKDLDWTIVFQIIVRTFIMFLLVITFLRLSGKKGIRQLSLFEVAIIISLGSAAGDPMFSKEAAILPSLIVIITVLVFYRVIIWLTSKSEKIESMLEGDPIYIIEEGEFILTDDKDAQYAKDEFFAEMRQQNIEHLGQIKTAILETNGTISFFYYPEEEVKYGLPVMPKLYVQKVQSIPNNDPYACSYCGRVTEETNSIKACTKCHKSEWVAAINTLRIT